MMRNNSGSDDVDWEPVEETLQEDDNAAAEVGQEDLIVEQEDPLDLALEDLAGRVVTAVDDMKVHSGQKEPNGPKIHQVYAEMLRLVLEIAAHTGPSIARTYYSAGGGIEASVEQVWEQVVSDVILPLVLEFAQSDTIPAKRAAALEFFHNFWKEGKKPGSWFDVSTSSPQHMGPYGVGGSSSNTSSANTPAERQIQKRRLLKRTAREFELLRYWINASIACTQPGVFTSAASEDAVASRGVIAASASLRPALRLISKKIQDADDRGASKLFKPVMTMVASVVRKLLHPDTGESVRSACIKFMEICVLSCSSKPPDPNKGRRGSAKVNMNDFSIQDLPEGHADITHEALESIAEYGMTTLRGLLVMGGQVKIDSNLLSDVMLINDGLPTSAVVNVLKPAALSYLAIDESPNSLDAIMNRSTMDYEFTLSRQSYSLTITAVSTLAVNRPVFFKEAATALARRAADPPSPNNAASLDNSTALLLTTHLKSTCLTLLRNPLSVTTQGADILSEALKTKYAMDVQADKAHGAANQAVALRSAGRLARQQAAMEYQWDETGGDNKRKRETDDALASLRAAKAARGLGHGIQLPVSMTDQMELILTNLVHLPATRPSGNSKNRKRRVDLAYVEELVKKNGDVLMEEDGRWYQGDGGSCWSKMDAESATRFELDSKTAAAAESEFDKTKLEQLDKKAQEEIPKQYREQCRVAASQAFSRIVQTAVNARDDGVKDFANQIAAKLAWTLKSGAPLAQLKTAHELAAESVHRVDSRPEEDGNMEIDGLDKKLLQRFLEEYPLVASALARDFISSGNSTADSSLPSTVSTASLTLSNSILNEAYLQSCKSDSSAAEELNYKNSIDVFAATVLRCSSQASDKPNDLEKKRVATLSASSITKQLEILPSVSTSALIIISRVTEIREITKRASEASKKGSSQTLAGAAAINATKVAAERRATAALLALRAVAFQRSNFETRQAAINCAVAIAAGHIPTSPPIEDKATKLVVNMFFEKSESHKSLVIEAARASLERSSQDAVANHDLVETANKEATKKTKDANQGPISSDIEKAALEKYKKPVTLFMAICVRVPELMKDLMQLSSVENADVLAKAVKQQMSKLARALAKKVGGEAEIALEVADMGGIEQVPMLLAFLDNLPATGDHGLPSEDLIEACLKIQESKLDQDEKKDPRFLLPVVTGMKRVALVERLPEFVLAGNNIFMAALVQMGSRLARHALIFRDEPDEENPVLQGMTLCESLVFLHKMDFESLGIPQKRYLEALRLCLDDENVFADTIVREALDYISGIFVKDEVDLPLPYMRTIIICCTKHESLHGFICRILLPRLVEGKIYQDRRQWEGWMRCARMLENAGVAGIQDAIQKLPQEQLEMYNTKYNK